MKTARQGPALLLLSLFTACVSAPSSETHGKGSAREALSGFVLSQSPSDVGARVDAEFDGKVTLLGARVEPAGAVHPGQKLKLTLYWKSEQKLEPGFQLFTHIVDAAGERLSNIDNVGPLREIDGGTQALPPSAWEPGKVYVDQQPFTVPLKVTTDKIQILTGIYGKHGRLTITSGPHDTTQRAIAASLVVNGAHPKHARVPTLRVEKLEPGVLIQIDGKLDEPAWQRAASTGPLVDVRTGEPNRQFPVNGEVKLTWNDAGMYVGFTVADTDLIGGFKKGERDPHLWTKDAVEIMVDPEGDGDNRDYYEIQINPQNLVFDSEFDAYNEPRVEPDGPFGHQEWSSKLKSAVTLDGTVDQSSDEDRGYTVEALIPWRSFDKASTLPPANGMSWRMNFYAMNNNGGVAWSPILGQGNFHKAARFGRVLWTIKGAPAPAPAAIVGQPVLPGQAPRPAASE